MMMKRTLAGLALLLAAPAIAQSDGTLGPTSSGSFSVNAIYTAAPVDNVQVYGLDNVTFNQEAGSLVFPSQQMIFCMIRTSAGGGNVGVTVLNTSHPLDFQFQMRGQSTTNILPMTLELATKGGAVVPLQPNVSNVFAVPEACTEGNSGEDARLQITLNGLPSEPDTYSETFLVSIAPQ